MNKYIYGVIAFISISVFLVGYHLIQQAGNQSVTEYAVHYQTPRHIANFTLTDEQGQPFSNKQLQGKWSFVFLGYTSCPDICPTTLQNLNFIYDKLTAIAENSQVLLVTADPKRDNQEKMAQYIAYFNPNFKALRAEHDVLFPFSRSLGLLYAIADKNTNSSEGEYENYWVDHSASIVLINPQGKIEAMFKPEQSIASVPTINNENLVSDYQKIVANFLSREQVN